MSMHPRRRTSTNDDEFRMEEVPSEGKLVHNAGELMGSATGEGTENIAPGGWEGTDDATSTEGSDLADSEDGLGAEAPEEAAIHVEHYPEFKGQARTR